MALSNLRTATVSSVYIVAGRKYANYANMK